MWRTSTEMTDYVCPRCGEHPQNIVENPATGRPHCPSCGTVLVDAREEHQREEAFEGEYFG
jgi:uncharacterized Zn finger protein (UPF0148 family)